VSDVRPITQNFARPSYRPAAQTGMDPDMRRMVVVAAGVGGVLAIVIGGLSFTGSGQHHAVPVIEPSALPVRVKPANPGGLQVAGADDFAPAGQEKLAPAAEKPAIRALRAKRIEHAAPHEAVVAAVKPAEPAVVAPAAPAPKVVASAAPPASHPAAGISVQLAAFESQQAAEQDWGKMAEKMPTFFNGHKPEVQRADLAGRVVYRLRTGDFATLAAASAFCAEVRTKGGDCSIAAF
jgi:hypothetical protein